ncbi:LysR family transcriptional regulator [Streptomyces sp. NPDC051555]|uniref:LysR family transcriptional regulator n=1 Tax=Streptomyces sp. NPDC051555 TaxID=3365657 RepID=UPI003795DE5A
MRTLLRIAGHPTYATACQALGLSTSSVTNHLLRLEADLDVQLLQRASKKRPIQLTLGQRVIDATLPLAGATGHPPRGHRTLAPSPVAQRHDPQQASACAGAFKRCGYAAALRIRRVRPFALSGSGQRCHRHQGFPLSR